MPRIDENKVKLCGGIVVWDEVSTPTVATQGKRAGDTHWKFKLAFEPSNPDLVLHNNLALKALAESPDFRGVLPPGGRMPQSVIGPNEFGGQFTGWVAVSFGTYYAPDIYDEAGTLIDPMQRAGLVYVGQRVDVLCHCYPYNTASKGIGSGLDAFGVSLSAPGQRLNLGSGDTAGAFAPTGAPPPQAAPAPGQQYAPPPQAAPAPGQQYAPPPQAAPGAPAQGRPQQAHDFLPAR